MNLEFFRQLSEITYQTSRKIRQVGTEFFLADGQTVGRDKADSRFRNFVKAITTQKYTL